MHASLHVLLEVSLGWGKKTPLYQSSCHRLSRLGRPTNKTPGLCKEWNTRLKRMRRTIWLLNHQLLTAGTPSYVSVPQSLGLLPLPATASRTQAWLIVPSAVKARSGVIGFCWKHLVLQISVARLLSPLFCVHVTVAWNTGRHVSFSSVISFLRSLWIITWATELVS